MKNIIPATKVRKNFFDLIQRVDATGGHVIVTVDGEAKAVIMDPEEFEGWQETIEIMSDPATVKAIKEGMRDIKAGRVKSFEQVHGMTPKQALRI